jgi:hypothetical protein
MSIGCLTACFLFASVGATLGFLIAGMFRVARHYDRSLREYFLSRAVALLEEAKEEREPERRYELEQRIVGYWRIAQGKAA